MLLVTSLKQEPNEENFDGDDANDKVNEDLIFFTINIVLIIIKWIFSIIKGTKTYSCGCTLNN